ncbi:MULTISPECIES: hypothetical protein [Paenibacillus]|uniref:DUF2334 domain-containing protein n=1 Tax=Paenibacillus albilobatus TaxID=2716884 RepID=A0A919XF02_9BACL|nr:MULTISPECIES: hypothetical protein [Paenibacillus]GIO29390.1 hypothetical protein J2TS6_05310 [Paenibacillus albilobatus]
MRRNHHRSYMMLLALLVVSLVFSVPVPVQAAEQTSFPSVLILYDSLGVGTKQEGNVEALKRLLAAFRVQVTAEPIDSYAAGSLNGYSKLVEVRNRSDWMEEPSGFLADLQSYQGGLLYIGEKPSDKLARSLGLRVQAARRTADLAIGPFVEKSIDVPYLFDSTQNEAKRYGTLKIHSSGASYPYGVLNGANAYVPFMEKDTLSEIALAYVLKDWLQDHQTGHYFLVFKEIYPFSDLSLLERMSDELFEAGIPFIVSVHPVFSNTDYPAMKRYINTLKYVQSRNGTVLVESPVVASTIQDLDRSMQRQMEHFIDELAKEGVVPLGMGTEMYWSYDEHYVSEGMAFFDSVVLYPDARPIYKAKRNRSTAFPSSLYSVNSAFLQRYLSDDRLIKPMPMDTAITFDFAENESELDRLVDGLKSSWITFEDYKNEAHSVKTGTNELASDRGSLVLNGVSLGIQASHVETSSDHVYKQQGKKSFETWFTVQNKIFIVIIFITLIVFCGFLMIGYRMYKRKFYK